MRSSEVSGSAPCCASLPQTASLWKGCQWYIRRTDGNVRLGSNPTFIILKLSTAHFPCATSQWSVQHSPLHGVLSKDVTLPICNGSCICSRKWQWCCFPTFILSSKVFLLLYSACKMATRSQSLKVALKINIKLFVWYSIIKCYLWRTRNSK